MPSQRRGSIFRVPALSVIGLAFFVRIKEVTNCESGDDTGNHHGGGAHWGVTPPHPLHFEILLLSGGHRC
ncbi:hypothetical protein Hanom_Chr01g00040001 [Helianthus anomalus]